MVTDSRYMYTGDDIKYSTPPPVNDVTYQHKDVPIMPQQEEVSAEEVSDAEQSPPKISEIQKFQRFPPLPPEVGKMARSIDILDS